MKTYETINQVSVSFLFQLNTAYRGINFMQMYTYLGFSLPFVLIFINYIYYCAAPPLNKLVTHSTAAFTKSDTATRATPVSGARNGT